MQWLDFLRDACVTAGAALADVTADALHGTSAVCAMTIRHVHQTLDDKRAAQAKEVKKIQGKMRVQFCREEETAKKTGGERPPEPDYEEVWDRPSELKNQIEGLLGALGVVKGELLSQIGLHAEEVDVSGELAPVSGGLDGFEFDATNVEWRRWLALGELVTLCLAAEDEVARARIQV